MLWRELKEICFEIQSNISVLLMSFSGGLRRQVVAGVKWNRIKRDLNGNYYIELEREKTHQRNTLGIPIHQKLVNILFFFIEWVRPILSDDAESIVNLWIDRNGNAMEAKSFSDMLSRKITQFNPYLKVTPIEFRRMGVTDLYAGKLDSREHSQEELKKMVSEYLSVQEHIMDCHYNRNQHYFQDKETQDILLQSRLTDTLESSCNLANLLTSRISNRLKKRTFV